MTRPNRTDRVIVDTDNRYPDTTPVRRTAWGAVIAGALVALMTTLLLSLLFTGIGLQSINPASEQNPLAGLGTGSIIAIIVTNLLSLFLGGYVAGRLAGSPRRSDGFLHGILTWGVLTLATIWLLTSAVGRIVGGVTSLVGSTVSTVAQGAAAVAPDSPQGATSALNQIPGLNVQQQIDQFLANAGVQNPEQVSQELVQSVTQRVQAGESLTSPQAQEELTDVLAQNTELSEQEIEQQVQEFSQQVDQAQQQVAQTAGQAAEVTGGAAIWAFIGLLLGAIVAALGAVAGSPKDPVEARTA